MQKLAMSTVVPVPSFSGGSWHPPPPAVAGFGATPNPSVRRRATAASRSTVRMPLLHRWVGGGSLSGDGLGQADRGVPVELGLEAEGDVAALPEEHPIGDA